MTASHQVGGLKGTWESKQKLRQENRAGQAGHTLVNE